MSAEKLQKYYGYGGLTVKRAYHQQHEQTLPKPVFSLVENNTLVGIEVEVENIQAPLSLSYYWKITKDGSLRNNGIEFVSIPLRTNQVEYALTYLATAIWENNVPMFSKRTSVHVHLNVRDFTWEQLKVFVLLYAVFEKHFFHFVGPERENNIFCVPLYKSAQLNTILEVESEPTWHKYNALNISPVYGNAGDGISKYGTIEFRHLYGTLDTKTIIDWINNICCLRKYSATQKLEDVLDQIKNLNTTSEYVELYNKIFGAYANVRLMTKYDFESCVSHVKCALWGNDANKKYIVEADSPYAKAVKANVVDKKGTLGTYKDLFTVYQTFVNNTPFTIPDNVVDGLMQDQPNVGGQG